MTAFIVRPFGKKNNVDFEKVDRELISPALERLNLSGRTTQEITEAGNIRADMFHLLLTADVVIADISIHNANVFYELGVRHALRDKWTVLIRASIDDVPFDLKTDRYLAYNAEEPKSSLDALLNTLEATKRNRDADSPVYSMLPGLKAPDPALFIVVPQDFQEEVQRAEQKGQKGDLRFLASELDGFRWRREGLRFIGEAQFRMGDRPAAIHTWETVRNEIPDDLQANFRLGTLYQKAGDLVLSDEALRRVVNDKGLTSNQLAEARALLGSNAKTRWVADWEAAPEDRRQVEALRSPFLTAALEEYRKGFESDTGHYYSGLNALALVTALTELAEAQPDVWLEKFEDSDEGAAKLKEYKTLRQLLNGAVEFALRAARQRSARENKADDWLGLSFADLAFLCGKPNAPALYRECLRLLGSFAAETAARQFRMFSSLGILARSVTAAGPIFSAASASGASAQMPRVLVFTGHRVDDPAREHPRFPPGQEDTARKAIQEAVQASLPADGSPVVAIAGGASGGDLLFLEVCEQLKIERRLYLIVPRDEFLKASVAPSGPRWIDRFQHQYEKAEQRREYQRSKELPVWLQEKKGYSVWQRANGWMLHNAIALGGQRTTLIALWDGERGDGPGGTQHMVAAAKNMGARTIILDTKQLFSLTRAAAPDT